MPPRQWLSAQRRKSLARILEIGAFVAFGIFCLFLLLLLVQRALLPVVAYFIPQLRIPFYDLGVYGAAPYQEFASFDLNAPKPWRTFWDKSCDGGHILVGPNGPSVPQPGPVILDTNGELIWMSEEYETVMNFNIQTYRGKDYITFWSGTKNGGTGEGEMIMLDSNYKVAYRIQAVGEGNKADIHEFRITKDNTALVAVSNKTQADLRSWPGFRPSDGWLRDGMFQEIDIETGELLFQWRAIEHFDPIENYYLDPFGGYVEWHAYDYYHLNSIEKDSKGNFLVSSRHFHHIAYIEGKTGEVLWTLGGHSKDFKDLSHGKATEHQWQHNARWVDEENGILTFMDNGAAGPLHVDAPYSKGTMVQLDLENMTAKRLHSYVSPSKVRAASQGNVEIINDDQVLVGWGATAAYTEFTMDGTPLCEVHFAASSLFWWERWKSYRVYRHFGWVGEPEYPPSTGIQGNSLFVSWNGATEVKFWELQGSRKEEGDDYESVETIEKRHFEESFVFPLDKDYVRYRVAALDGQKKVLHRSEEVLQSSRNVPHRSKPKKPTEPTEPTEREGGLGWAAGIAIGVGVAVSVVLGVWFGIRFVIRRRQEGRKVFTWAPTELFGRNEYQYSKL